MHVACGRLRGRAAPSDRILDRVVGLCPTFRVHWHPWADDGKWYWLIGNRIGSPVYQETGRYALERIEAQARALQRPPEPGWVAGAELMLDGDYIVARFTNEEFGGDHMFRVLQGIRDNLRKAEAALDEQARVRRLQTEWRLASSERRRNAAFQEYLQALVQQNPQWIADQEAMLKEAWPYYMRRQHSVTVLEGTCASPGSVIPTPAASSGPAMTGAGSAA